MNYLAHLSLSDGHHLVMVGNFIADQVKGRAYATHWPPQVALGISLHREIDQFADTHPIFRKSKRRLVKKYNHYSGVIVDVFYDHFLARHWQKYYSKPLPLFIDDVYKILKTYHDTFPPAMQRVYDFMVRDRWLEQYNHPKGIATVLSAMARRTAFTSNLEKAGEDLILLYDDFEQDFLLFFPEIKAFCAQYLNQKKMG